MSEASASAEKSTLLTLVQAFKDEKVLHKLVGCDVTHAEKDATQETWARMWTSLFTEFKKLVPLTTARVLSNADGIISGVIDSLGWTSIKAEPRGDDSVESQSSEVLQVAVPTINTKKEHFVTVQYCDDFEDDSMIQLKAEEAEVDSKILSKSSDAEVLGVACSSRLLKGFKD
eukprot:11014062-Karenia_brevis.AAC.1